MPETVLTSGGLVASLLLRVMATPGALSAAAVLANILDGRCVPFSCVWSAVSTSRCAEALCFRLEAQHLTANTMPIIRTKPKPIKATIKDCGVSGCEHTRSCVSDGGVDFSTSPLHLRRGHRCLLITAASYHGRARRRHGSYCCCCCTTAVVATSYY
jgi:hypothetical protein